MTILASLVHAYGRLADRGEVPPFGYSTEKIGFVIPLNDDGTPAGRPISLRDESGKKPILRSMAVPQPAKRTSGIAPNFLWDKTSYALGITAGEGRRTAAEHAAFVAHHRTALSGTNDAGLAAVLRFLETWKPEDFGRLEWPDEMKDQNVVFALESERRRNIMLHDRPAARAVWARISFSAESPDGICLVTGEHGPIVRLHPSVKGVWGAQSSGAKLVSFNLGAFTSYGHEQGDNAPVSEAAAFAYTTALNRFLEKDSPNRLQVGDASTVFWADASDASAREVEGTFAAMLGVQKRDDTTEAKKVRAILEKIRSGRPLAEAALGLPEGVRFYVLGLAPNAARLSVRFWLEDDFGAIARRYFAHLQAMQIVPPPREENPSLWRFLIETAPQNKTENIPPNLAGEWLRAILTGMAYPLTLMSTLLMRMRADKEVNALRVGMIKSVLVKNFRTEVPVSLDSENKDPGYLLGRLFAAYEYAQTQALGRSVNATIRDQYYGTASATPRAVFPLLQRKATHHLSRLRKDQPDRARWLDDQIGRIFELAEADKLFVPTLTAQRQAMFAVGYYHQKNEFYRRKNTGVGQTAAEMEETTA